VKPICGRPEWRFLRGELFVQLQRKYFSARSTVPRCFLKQNLIAELKLPSHVVLAPSNQETKMKFAFRKLGIQKQQGESTMMKTLALAASIMTLIAISGQAFADTAPKNVRYWPAATAPSDQQAYAFNAFDQAFAKQTTEPDAYRYHGGPKSND
jgi:hypothetical protein